MMPARINLANLLVLSPIELVVDLQGLEPRTSEVSVRRSNQSELKIIFQWLTQGIAFVYLYQTEDVTCGVLELEGFPITR